MASLPISTTSIDVDEFCALFHEIFTVDTNEHVYSSLPVLIHALLALGASSGDSEGCFLMVPKN